MRSRVLWANAALAVLLVGHVVDHVARQPDSAQLDGFANAPGIAGLVAVFLSLGLLLARMPRALEFATLVGAATALGFVAIHLLPDWSMFSDPYPDRDLDAASWIEMLATLAAGALLMSEALRARRTLA
jgi:hypothetical protein